MRKEPTLLPQARTRPAFSGLAARFYKKEKFPSPTGEGSQVTWCPWRFLRADRGSVCIKYNPRDSHPSPAGRGTGAHPFCGVTREESVGLSRLEALVAPYATFD